MKAKAAALNYCLPTYYRLPSAIPVFLNVSTAGVVGNDTRSQPVKHKNIASLPVAEPEIHHLRDGDVVLFKVPRSKFWQARYKLLNGKWMRFSTRQRRQVDAAFIACERYDEARFRERMGLAPVVKRFCDVADACVKDMQRDIAAGIGKRVYKDYIQVIERYLVPFFGQRHLTSIDAQLVAEFEAWRNVEMKRTPKSSTLLTFASAFSRIHQTAIARGWISERVPFPKLSVKGEKGQARPAFTAEEVQRLRDYLFDWHTKVEGRTQEMRRLLRELVDVLLLTGMRQGTESKNLRWKHIEWHREGDKRYLRIWVSGKTGPRWLIAKHECVTALQRLHSSQPDIAHIDFETLIASKVDLLVFRFPDGTQPYEFTAVFRRALAETGLTQGTAGTARSLYSLRHTYATQELLAGTDIHTLSKQMGTSVVMLERHYSKLTATLAAEQLA
jgi:integrase